MVLEANGTLHSRWGCRIKFSFTFFYPSIFSLKQGSWCIKVCQAVLHGRLWSQNCGISLWVYGRFIDSLLVNSICLISRKKKLDGTVCVYGWMRLWGSEPAAPAPNRLSVFLLVPVAGALCKEGSFFHSLLWIGHLVLRSFAAWERD